MGSDYKPWDAEKWLKSRQSGEWEKRGGGRGEGRDKGENKKSRGGSNRRGGEKEGNNYSIYKNKYSIYI